MTPCTQARGRLRSDGYVDRWFHGRHEKAHRIAWMEGRGPIPDGVDVLHTCDNRSCDNLDHLYLGTDLDNARDREQRGRGVRIRGEAHRGARLTEATVRQIRELASGGLSQRLIARRFGVSQRTIVKVVHRINWKEVE